MEFKESEAKTTKSGHLIETYVYAKPVQKYDCPSCLKTKRKFVGEFQYVDEKQERGFKATFGEDAVCVDCFETKEYGALLNKFYDTDIY